MHPSVVSIAARITCGIGAQILQQRLTSNETGCYFRLLISVATKAVSHLNYSCRIMRCSRPLFSECLLFSGGNIFKVAHCAICAGLNGVVFVFCFMLKMY